jgi:hypothetical protein
MLPLEGTLLEKLRKIEALHAGTNIDGEREAARRAAERIRARLAELRSREREEILVYSLPDPRKREAVRGAVPPLRVEAVPRVRTQLQHGAGASA